MTYEISRISYGVFFEANVYLLKNVENPDQSIIIDAPKKNFVQKSLDGIKKAGLKYEDISTIIITHSHYDHVQGLKDFKKELKKAQVVIHESEANDLKNGVFEMPRGSYLVTLFTKFIDFLNNRIGFLNYEGVEAEIVIKDKFRVDENCIVIHTPGHSKGSVSIIVDDKAFVGDLMYNNFKGWFGNYPWFFEDTNEMFKHWRKLINMGCKTFYPAHGMPFDSSVIEKFLKKYVPDENDEEEDKIKDDEEGEGEEESEEIEIDDIPE